MNTPELPPKVKARAHNLIGLLVCYREGGVWFASSDEQIADCELLVTEGWALETTALHVSEGDETRCWQLTIKGARANEHIKLNQARIEPSTDE